MTPEDEKAFFRQISRLALDVYPVRVPPDWQPFKASEATVEQLPPEDLYLAASQLGPVLVDKVKRGPHKGDWRVDEVKSPVIYFERCRMNEEQELLSGKMWAELEITAQTGRRDAAPDKFRRLFLDIEEWIKKTFRKGIPKEFIVGPHAARRVKEGLVLRDSDFRGSTVKVHK